MPSLSPEDRSDGASAQRSAPQGLTLKRPTRAKGLAVAGQPAIDAPRAHQTFARWSTSSARSTVFAPAGARLHQRLRRRWQRAAEQDHRVDAPGDLKRFTVDVTSGLAFGTDLNTLETVGDVIQKHLGVVFPVLAKRVLASNQVN